MDRSEIVTALTALGAALDARGTTGEPYKVKTHVHRHPTQPRRLPTSRPMAGTLALGPLKQDPIKIG
jgi:hypothetical protein